jgi:hypothetical protein
MKIDIGINIDSKDKKGGLMGVSLDEIQTEPIVIKKKKKKKKKSLLAKVLESSIPVKSEYTTEVI